MRLLECVAGVEEVVVAVDRRDVPGMSIGREGRDETTALWFEDGSFVRRSEFDHAEPGWVRIDRDDADDRELVEDALGPSLAAYVLAARLPPSPADLVASAIEFAADIEVIEPPAEDLSNEVSVAIDEQRVAQLAGTGAAGYPKLTFALDEGSVAAVSARSDADPDSFGFRWEYRDEAAVVPDGPEDWVEAREVAVARVGQRELTCELGP